MNKVLVTQPWANTPKVLVNLVRSLVRLRLFYGLEAMPHLTETGLARLTNIEVAVSKWPSDCRRLHHRIWCAEKLVYYRFAIRSNLAVPSMSLEARPWKTQSTVSETDDSFREPAQLRFCSSICDLVRD